MYQLKIIFPGNLIINPSNTITTTITNTTSFELNPVTPSPVATANAPDLTGTPIGTTSSQPTPTSDSSGAASVMSKECFVFAVSVAVLNIMSHN